ncbi:MAG: hypothetical protein ACRC62_05960 [Microcoleus sp.]
MIFYSRGKKEEGRRKKELPVALKEEERGTHSKALYDLKCL